MNILIALIPTIVTAVEGLIPHSSDTDQKKQLAMDILGSLYDKYAAKILPPVPGVDEKAIAMDLFSWGYDVAVKKFS